MSNPYLSLLEEARDISAAKDWVYADRRNEWVQALKHDALIADRLMDERRSGNPVFEARKAERYPQSVGA